MITFGPKFRLRLILITGAVCLHCHTAYADMTPLQTESKDFSAYIDKSTVTKTENGYAVWVIVSYPKPQSALLGDYQSVKNQYEFDCKAAQYKNLYEMRQSGPMGKGETLTLDSFLGWWDAVPATGDKRAAFNAVCKK